MSHQAEGSHERTLLAVMNALNVRAGTSLNAAAERTEAFERYVTADLDHVAFIGECVCRKRRLPEKVIANFFAMAVESGSAAVQPRSTEAEWERLLAMCHPSQATRHTTSTGQERQHHGIAARYFDNISTYALHDSCAFMSEHDWLWHRVALVTCNHICVAQAGGYDLDQHFVSARVF